ncbi:hypothetical protein ACXYUI_28835, partial [Klebsiella pneumoniae]
MIISFAQVMLALWFCGSIQKELRETKRYAGSARMITVQMKDPNASLDPVREALSGDEVTFEELKTDEV